MQAKPKLTRKKIGDRNYNIVTEDGTLVGNVVMTGEYSRDPYPWEFSMTDSLYEQLKTTDIPKHWKTMGSVESLRDGVDTIASLISQFNLKP